MKEVINIRSNTYYEQKAGDKTFVLKPLMELVIIHTNGKDYKLNKEGDLVGEYVFSEHRLLVNPELLTQLITELQLHQKKFEQIKINADKLTSLVQYISEPEPPQA